MGCSQPGRRRAVQLLLVASALLGVASSPVVARAQAADPFEAPRQITAVPDCPAAPLGGQSDQIIVCGKSEARKAREKQLYRLPLHEEAPTGERTRGEVARATIDPGNNAPCGIFAGQRRCSKAESRAFGYGAGRDPLTVLLKAGRLALDGDADVSEPAALAPPRPR